jgi:O-antigen ligase
MILKKSLDRILLFLLSLIPFITLVQFDDTIYPYVTSKHFTFRILILLAGAFWFVLSFFDEKVRPHFSRLLGSFLVFMGVVFVADLAGSNFWNSFWSNYSRMEGFISLIYFLLFFLMLSSTLNSKKRWQSYWLIHVLVSFVILAIAILQKMRLMVAVDYNRVDSVFGNSSYLAIYSSMIFFLCLYLYFSFASRWMRALLIVGALVNLGSIYLSQTRSATLGVFISLGFFFYAIARNKKKALLYSGIVLSLFVVSVFIFKSKTQLSTNLFERIASMSFKEGSIQARIEIWKYCLRAISAQPWLGWGQENFAYLAKFYQPSLWSTPWVDRSHNIFIEWMINAGVFGLLAILAVLYFLVQGILKAALIDLQRPQKLALFGFFLAWFINQCLSIDFFSISILFYSLMAWVHSIQVQRVEFQPNPLMQNRPYLRASFLVISFLTLGVYLNYEVNYRSLMKNIQIRSISSFDRIEEFCRDGSYKARFDEAIQDLRSFEMREMRVFAIQNAMFIVGLMRSTKASVEVTQYAYDQANRITQEQLQNDPKALFFKHVAANFYTQFGNYPLAQKLFTELIQAVPRQQNFWIDYGHLLLAQNHPESALSSYQKAYDLDHDYELAEMFLAMGFVYNNQFTEANAIVDSMMKEMKSAVFDDRLVNAYLSHNQKDKAVEIVKFKDKYFGTETK